MYEAEFIEKTRVRVIIGKGWMSAKTAEACKKFGARDNVKRQVEVNLRRAYSIIGLKTES